MAKAQARVTLPGSLYQKNGRWWWNVDLPGENKTRARALKPNGSRCATKDYEQAEEIAREMWRRAIEAEAEPRITAKALANAQKAVEKIRAEAAEAIAAAQAECEKKIKTSKRAVARAEKKAKVQAEARLRAEAGYEVQTEEIEERYTKDIARIKRTIEQAKAELIEKDKAYKEALNEAEQKVTLEIRARQEAESRAKAEENLRIDAEQNAAQQIAARREAEAGVQVEAELRAAAEQRADSLVEAVSQAESKAQQETELRLQAEQRAESEAQARIQAEEKLNEILESMQRTGACECCGRKDVPENNLAKIDSGQKLCPDCLKLLRG